MCKEDALQKPEMMTIAARQKGETHQAQYERLNEFRYTAKAQVYSYIYQTVINGATRRRRRRRRTRMKKKKKKQEKKT